MPVLYLAVGWFMWRLPIVAAYLTPGTRGYYWLVMKIGESEFSGASSPIWKPAFMRAGDPGERLSVGGGALI